MALSAFELYSIGIGPSSSHTVGPMRAAGRFLESLREAGLFDDVARVQVELCGSLGQTGHGHGSDKAVVLGPERPREVARHLKEMLGGSAEVAVVDINDLGGNILGSTLDKAGERRLVAILKDNPLGQGHQSTPLGVVRAA